MSPQPRSGRVEARAPGRRLSRRRSPRRACPARGSGPRARGRGTRAPGSGARRSSTQRRQLVDVELEPAPVDGDDQPEPDDDLGGRDGHHREREDLPVEVGVVAREGDQRQVRAVEHDLDREQNDQRAPPEHHAERADREQERGDGEVPGEVRAHHSARVPPCNAVLLEDFGWSSWAWLPRTTPPTAAASSTIDVISNASRWSLKNTRPISLGLPNAAPMSGASASRPLALSPTTTTISTISAPAAATAPSACQLGPPAQGASAWRPR